MLDGDIVHSAHLPLFTTMCEVFHGLKRHPFLLSPDVDSYFSADIMEESRQNIEKALKDHAKISLVFGAAGTGKTLLMRVIRNLFEKDRRIALLSNCRLETPNELFLQLAHDLQISPVGTETVALRLQLLDFAKKHIDQQHADRQELVSGIIMLFDDAQHLSPAVLEEIRQLTDCADGIEPMFQSVLAGTLEFEEKLTLPHLEAFNQRVAARCYLDSFSHEETSQYILRQTDLLRIDPPHTQSAPQFCDEAQRRIYQLTDGVPRLVNQLCSAALQIAVQRNTHNIDGSIVNDAWAGMQHIDTAATESANRTMHGSGESQKPAISQKQIDAIVDRKKNTFQLKQFNPVEFGTLSETEPLQRKSEYKPPYPDFEDDEDVDDSQAEVCESEPAILRLNKTLSEQRSLKTVLEDDLFEPDRCPAPKDTDEEPSTEASAVSASTEVKEASALTEVSEVSALTEVSEASALSEVIAVSELTEVSEASESCDIEFRATYFKVSAIPRRKRILDSIKRQQHIFRRRYLLKKIRNRLGLFVGVFLKNVSRQKQETEQNQDTVLQDHTLTPIIPSTNIPSTNELAMNAQSLQKYGTAVLEGKPPFVRKEPQYAYQTTETAPHCVNYPDPKTGMPIALNWFCEKTEDDSRFGVSYSEFLMRGQNAKQTETHLEKLIKPEHNGQQRETACQEITALSVETPSAMHNQQSEPKAEALKLQTPAGVVQTSLNASQNIMVIPKQSGLEESFDEFQQVCTSTISLAELFRANVGSANFSNLDATVQDQLEAVIKRITRAAEKIEQAAGVSEQAGRHISKTAEFVETEVKTALPTYKELFTQWSEFQDTITSEIEAARRRNMDPRNPDQPRLQPFSRRQVLIERNVPTIDVEMFLR